MRLQDYLIEVTKIKLLEMDEERELWLNYKHHGNMEARSRLIEHYQPLVVKVLSRWRGQESALMDLVQEGIVGLIEAVERFDPDRQVAFSLYAIHRIRGRMLNYMEQESKSTTFCYESAAGIADGLSLADMIADPSMSVAELAEKRIIRDQLMTAMERLPSKERLALNGVYLQEQEPKQVASALHVSPSHLSRLQKQGIRRVRGMLSRLMAEMKK